MILRLFLLLLAVLIVWRAIRRWRALQAARRTGPLVEAARKCPDCDAYVLGSHPGPCARSDCRYR